MNDNRLIALYYHYGKIAYGMAYYSLMNKGIEFSYENLKNEIETTLEETAIEENMQLTKSR